MDDIFGFLNLFAIAPVRVLIEKIVPGGRGGCLAAGSSPAQGSHSSRPAE